MKQKRNGKPNPASITLREAFETVYRRQHVGITDGTLRTSRHRINCWERLVPACSVSEITRQHFDTMRSGMLAAGYSTASIESLVSVARTIIKACVEDGILSGCPSVGKRLKARAKPRWTPEVADLSRIYRTVHRTTWPVRRVPAGGWTGTACADNGGFVRSFSADHWWRTFFACGYFLGLRKGDLLDLRWADIKSDRIIRTMAKTEYAVELPIHDTLRCHLDLMPRDSERVFGPRGKSNKQLQRELHLMADAAGIGRFTMQGLRRLSARCFETARAGAGCCILGHRIRGAAASYLDGYRILSDALPSLAVPDAMKPKSAEEAAASDPFTIVVSSWGA
jgi:integrase